MAVKVRKRRDKWWVYIDHNNKRKAKCIGPSKRAADQVAEKIRAKLALGEMGILDTEKEAPSITFAEYHRHWFQQYVVTTKKIRTQEQYEMIGRLHLLPVFGDARYVTSRQKRSVSWPSASSPRVERPILYAGSWWR